MKDEKRRELLNVKAELEKVSASFCLAKWTTVTMHLQLGTTHSCHHPAPHPVPTEELQKNFRAIHNTSFKIEQRQKMLQGEYAAECEYCWNIENLKNAEFSDRIIKSSEPYSFPELRRILKDPLRNDERPTYLEVSFSNKCQFKCSYCSANNSSSWDEEIRKFGPYATYSGMRSGSILDEEENPYVSAFWQWWPELRENLHTFRITGGEPLLASSTFRILENLIAQPQPKLHLVVNTNLGAPDVLIEKFISLSAELLRTNSVASIEVYTSAEAHGARAEYIRYGLVYEKFWKNIDRILEAHQRLNVKIMSTFNALSLTSYAEFLEKVIEVNRKFQNGTNRLLPLYVDISYLRYPQYQSVRVLPAEYLDKMKNLVEWCESRLWYKCPDKVGLHDLQINSLRRIYEWMKVSSSLDEKVRLQRDFKLFFSEHDRRRSTDFLNTFPEMGDFWRSI